MSSSKQLAIAAYLVTVAAALVIVATLRGFDPDEFQHVQMAWRISIGDVPYRDFFEHHTPLWHMAAAGIVANMPAATDPDAAVRTVFALRMVGCLLSLGILGLTYSLASRHFGRIAGLLAAVLLSSSPAFVAVAMEVRPDQLAALLMLASVTLADREEAKARGGRWRVVTAGAAFALAILTTQKALMAAPGFAVMLALSRRRSSRQAAWFGIGAAVAIAPMLAWFAAHGALGAFLHDNFALGAGWEHKPNALLARLSGFAQYDVLFLILASVGVATAWKDGDRRTLALAAPGLSMLACAPLFPVVGSQYVFLLLPFLAVVAAYGARQIGERIPREAVASVVTVAVVHGLVMSFTPLATWPSNGPDLAKLRYVVGRTNPADLVLRSWGHGVAFRRSPFFYESLNEEIVRTISPAQRSKLGQIIGDGVPEVLEVDQAFRTNFPELLPTVARRYEPTGVDTLWRRNPVTMKKAER